MVNQYSFVAILCEYSVMSHNFSLAAPDFVPHAEHEVVIIPDGEHPLETPWSLWYEHKPKSAEEGDFAASLVRLGSFATVEEFWRWVPILIRRCWRFN